ncbi:MAG: aspartate-semialdehyde dehydrogenase [Clostridiales bacterium]|jgi:aspartate-semialdehyde dehydrogenase|nr:aspartate-semialdehyde dehydrogenase [Clostridiales bacterium]
MKIAVVGATGAIGRTFLKVLSERNFPMDELYLFASARSARQELECRGKIYKVEELDEHSFDRGVDIALFSAGGEISLKYAPIAAAEGCVVVDNSSAWRMKDDVPLVVPEVNPEDIKWHKGIIANPNCSTIQAVAALWPLHRAYGVKRIVYSTYQAVAGAGMSGVRDLEEGLKGGAPKKFPHPIAGNCLPQIDVFLEDGYTKEEEKMINETRKIMHAPELKATATCVRVPVFYGHSESINAEFEKPYDLAELRELLRNSPGIVVQDDPGAGIYPMPVNAAGADDVYVGRIRRDNSVESGVNLWVVSDSTRKGAAYNAIQIAELLSKNNLPWKRAIN